MNALLSPTVIDDGQVVGTWTRTLEKRGVSVAIRFFSRSSRPAAHALEAAAKRYAAFLGRTVKTWPSAARCAIGMGHFRMKRRVRNARPP